MHALSPEDSAFRLAFEEGRVAPEAFDHRAHVRLAYAYLAENDSETAALRMRTALQGFLQRWAIAPHALLGVAVVLRRGARRVRGTRHEPDSAVSLTPAVTDKQRSTHEDVALHVLAYELPVLPPLTSRRRGSPPPAAAPTPP